jgi:hypothetical protein
MQPPPSSAVSRLVETEPSQLMASILTQYASQLVAVHPERQPGQT